jgi:hypothetical protein
LRRLLESQVKRIFQKGRFAKDDLLAEIREAVGAHVRLRSAVAPTQ